MQTPLPSMPGRAHAAGQVGTTAQEDRAAPSAHRSGRFAGHVGEPLADSRIGALLQQAGKLTADGVARVMRAQLESGLPFGAAALRLGLVHQDDIDAVIADQFAYPVAAPGASQLSPRLVVAFHPGSAQSDTLRAIRSQLLLRWFDIGRHALVISGAGSGDASSVLAANLALVFAQLGQRTLLVDANLHHGIQHALFGLQAPHRQPLPELVWPDPALPADAGPPPDVSWPGLSWPGLSRPGLSDILVGRAGLDAIVDVTGFPALSLLPSGTVPPNPQELLERASFVALHRQLGAAYDVVLYDAAPTGHGAAALAVATHAGAALLVAQTHRTLVAPLKQLAQQMTAANVTVIGSVLVES